MKLKFLLVFALSVYECLGIDERRSCDDQCTPTYPLHTYPKTDHYIACTRGCRLAYLSSYSSDGTASSCNNTCYEAYMSDNGAAYACSVGCGVSVQTIIDDEIAQISMMNNLMDVLFVSRVMDMLSNDGEARGDTREVWSDEVDVYLSEDFTTTTTTTTGNSTDGTSDVRWDVYSFVWFLDTGSSQVTTSTQVETSQKSDSSNGYYLIYYKQWSLTQTGLFPQLICYITLFLFMVALLKCCHMLVYDGSDDGNDDSNEGLSIRADDSYESSEDDDDDDDEMMALLQKKRQYMTGIVQKPPHTEHMLISMTSLLPVQNTKLNNGGKVEGILTVV